VHELDLRATQLSGLTDLLHEVFFQARPDRLYWLVIERRSGRPLLQVVPTDAGRTLAERVIQDKATVVFTSASLAVADSFEYFRRGVGLRGADAHELILASPFDYLSQALLCLPTDLKELDDPEFLDQTAASVASIARQLEGRTLVLFTAHQQLRDVADRLRPLSAADGILVMAQNVDGTRRQLLEQFREHPRTILLGTSSFWQGIDVPGDALSCVVIVRLPFGVPTDPTRVARSAGLRDPFSELMLPEAVLRLKQGFGRLIRKRTDRGAVVLLDHRVANRAYGQAFLDALPRAAVHVGLSDEMAPTIGRWLERA
jgi:Rad3-related DNA helicase